MTSETCTLQERPGPFSIPYLTGILRGSVLLTSSWCPGTSATGRAAGRIDPLVFLMGAVDGSILLKEISPLVRSLNESGKQGVQMAYNVVEHARNRCSSLSAVAAFWLSTRAISRFVLPDDFQSC